jgi:hypothetical protein
VPLLLEGTPAVWTEGSVTIDVGDGRLRPLGGVVADDLEKRPDATGGRFAGRVALRVDLLARRVPPAGSDAPAGEVETEWQRVRAPERRLDELQDVREPMLARRRGRVASWRRSSGSGAAAVILASTPSSVAIVAAASSRTRPTAAFRARSRSTSEALAKATDAGLPAGTRVASGVVVAVGVRG